MVVDVTERLIFYPKLKHFYSDRLSKKRQQNISRPPTIIDVGSNKGQTIDFFLKINPNCKVFAFEPNTFLFNKLKKKYKNNSKIYLNNYGISSQKGKLLFHENMMNETSTFEKLNYDSEYLRKKAKVLGLPVDQIIVDTYEVEVITLLSFLEEHPDDFIDVLKIDVEGHEYDCLLGLFNKSVSNHSIRFIQLESHNDDMYLNNKSPEEITGLLRINGFEEVIKIKHSYGDFYEIIYKNIYFS
jgi:FkbM family methyltransferase